MADEKLMWRERIKLREGKDYFIYIYIFNKDIWETIKDERDLDLVDWRSKSKYGNNKNNIILILILGKLF